MRTTLSWANLAAIPETFGTAWGSLELLALRAGETLLIRGATFSVGMAATTLAKARGIAVIATTRQASKRAALEANGADHIIIDDGSIAARVRQVAPAGADALFELVGPSSMLNSLGALRAGGRACLSGYLGGSREQEIARNGAARSGITLSVFMSSVINDRSYRGIFQSIIDNAESGTCRLNLDRTFPLERIADAHRFMEENRACGKVVGVTDP